MIVLDADVLIALFDAGDALHERANGVADVIAGERTGVATLTLAEVLVQAARAGREGEMRADIADLDIVEVPLSAAAAVQLAALRAATGLRVPDCCVVLAAQDAGAAAVATFDAGLQRGLDGLGLAYVS